MERKKKTKLVAIAVCVIAVLSVNYMQTMDFFLVWQLTATENPPQLNIIAILG